MYKLLLITALTILISGCDQYTIVKSEQQTVKSFIVNPTGEWNKVPKIFSLSGLPTWTVDGISLNSLSFISEVEVGDTLLPNTDEKKYQTFEADMLPTELVELIESSFALAYGAKVVYKGKLKPIKIGLTQGFQYDFEFVASDDLSRKGFIAAAVKNDQLHLIFYQAAKLHYYDTYFEDVVHIVNTASIK